MTGRERIRATIEGRGRDRLALMPITMMFAADTAGVRYGEYAGDAQVLADAQMLAAEKFGFDYVSAISDPAREASDLGATVQWFDDQPPAIIEELALLTDKARLGRMRIPDCSPEGRMHDRLRAVELLKKAAGNEKMVEGWVEGPCAMGADLRGINTLMLDFSDDPSFVRDLFQFATDMELAFAKEQIRAGAEIIGIGDAACSLIGPKRYSEFVLSYEKELVAGIHDAGALVRLHICGNTRRILAGMGETGADIIDLDYPVPIAEARAAMKPDQVLLGNLDPVRCLRDRNPSVVEDAIARCHEEAGRPFIVGAGCEIARGTPDANNLALQSYAKAHS